ncbi:RNA-binding protein [Neisseria zoodegmatis]|uniref:Dual-specificity RNA pseudouridine synthase RluF n=1 Tax=Neisseria zoodegmatis TaxID=326523 RepID=A0A378WT95_9NEIS|nr:pseudouridine synthase [Neisseria zoodegmatis]SUA44476.1 RNA-binding protein [Neisseria zoodegmatis]
MQPPSNEPIRLSKRMAELGLCSRREADSYIEQGWVKVNGQTAVLGQKVTAADRIDLNKQAHEKQAQRVTILLNKPVGYVSAQAEKGYKSAAELITPENHWEGDTSRIEFSEKHRFGLAPAGRLDIDSVGLLVLTQDGRIAKQLIGENSSSEKEYLVRVRGKLSDEGLKLLNHGLSLDGEKLKPAQVEWQNEDQLRFVLKQGKKRQIRRMCELVGLRVTGLKRIRMGKVKLGRLPPGKWRYLRHDEQF